MQARFWSKGILGMGWMVVGWVLVWGGMGEVRGAVGDIVSARVETNGWVLRLRLEGMGANGVAQMGLGPNFAVSGVGADPRATLRLSSPGFDVFGAAQSVSRVVYGAIALRKPYPEHALIDTVAVGSDVELRLALTDYVYAGDSGLSLETKAGLYSQGGRASTAGQVLVANESLLGHTKVVGNWSMPGYNLATGSSIRMRAVAFHRHGREGKPLAAMEFRVTDGVTTKRTLVREMQQSELPDAVLVQEYIGEVSTEGLADGPITLDFRAYPWVGDLAAVQDTADGRYVGVTPKYTSQQGWLVKSGAIPGSVAVVGPAGDDATGVAVTRASFNPNAPPPAFRTIGTAADRVAALNQTQFGRHDTGLSIVYLKDGNHLWAGSGGDFGNLPRTWLTIRPYPGVKRSEVVFTNVAVNFRLGLRTKFEEVTWRLTTNTVHNRATNVWFDRCVIDFPVSGQFVGRLVGPFVWYVTHCDVVALGQGFRPFAAQNGPCALVRGNVLSPGTHSILPYTVLGNLRSGVGSGDTANYVVADIAGTAAATTDGWIMAYNKFFQMNSSGGQVLNFARITPQHHGCAFVQNLVEVINGRRPAVAFQGAYAVSETMLNTIVGDNTVVGAEAAIWLDDSGPNPQNRILSKIYRNYFQDASIRSETVNGASGGPDGTRIGNWPDLHRVGGYGNVEGEIAGIGQVSSLPTRFPGVNSFQLPDGATQPVGWEQFIAYRGYTGVAGEGNGDYRLGAGSPLRTLVNPGDWMVPRDIDGRPRVGSSPAGAYAISESDLMAQPPTFLLLLKGE